MTEEQDVSKHRRNNNYVHFNIQPIVTQRASFSYSEMI